MAERIYCGHPGIGAGPVEGSAIVATDNFSARYDLDLVRGIFSRPGHKLHGRTFGQKVIVLNIAKGGVASAWMLHSLMHGAHRPLALILNWANPIMAQGAAFAELPLIDRFDVDITSVIVDGERLRVEPETGTVTALGGANS